MQSEVQQLTFFDQDIWFGKTSPELSVLPKVKTLGRSSKKLSELSIAPVMFLDLTQGVSNILGLSYWEMNSAWLGESLMHNTGESPNVAVESFLSQILEDSPHPKYYLSQTACLGILRRAKARDKELPPQLKTALEIQAGIYTEDTLTNQKEKIGFDGYAGDVTGSIASTLGTNCGCSTGRNGVIEPTICLCDQGGDRMDVCENVTGTLRASMGGNQPIVMATQQGGAEICENLCPTITSAAGMSGNNQPALFDNHGKDCRYNGPLKVAPTVAATYGTGGNNIPLLSQPLAFSLDSKESNSMKSSNPLSGCRRTDKARTLDTSNPDPSKNQGGVAILQPQESFCIAANTIDRQPKNGGNGQGVQTDISYTLTTSDIHAIYKPECEESLSVFGGTGFADFAEGISTLRASGGTNGGGSENLAVNKNLVRRLTPLECERLQGFPDGWTKIPKAADSPRYKALGNSVAIPCVEYVMSGIAFFLKQQKEES